MFFCLILYWSFSLENSRRDGQVPFGCKSSFPMVLLRFGAKEQEASKSVDSIWSTIICMTKSRRGSSWPFLTHRQSHNTQVLENYGWKIKFYALRIVEVPPKTNSLPRWPIRVWENIRMREMMLPFKCALALAIGRWQAPKSEPSVASFLLGVYEHKEEEEGDRGRQQ